MGPNITSKRLGAKPGQRCSNPKIPRLLAELGVQGFGCLEPSTWKSAAGTLQDAYNRNPTLPTSRKSNSLVNVPSRSYMSPCCRYDHKNKSQPVWRCALRKAARTGSSSKLKTPQHGAPGAEDDTELFMPEYVYTQSPVLYPPAPTGYPTHYPVGHLSSQPETLQLAKSQLGFQAESGTVHDSPLGTPSHITSKTSSPPHAREAQSN
ncbi:hypothetical protein PYCCODRAFT_1457650 [Trametes coccinea BRFM310]|uniref:Uncharacterized protein n=1 Tax=Trametes coccinea (strain BRFM310) TaxID=1353009 RepID=A0A1Y2IVK3_TRAC3|nr:hypothetical protein PYCCODRAFT_1457650 [Trametes coccinea BRFM310]